MCDPPQLRIPGPTPIPDRVVRAASGPMIDPRGPECRELLHECADGVRWALQTANDVVMFPASGTGGLEAAVANLLSPGERALFCTAGWFGDVWAAIAGAYGADVALLRAPWGEQIDPVEIGRVLDADRAIRKVFVTHNETSTGVLNDLHAISAVVKERGCLLSVDSVSGVPCQPLPVDELGIDIVVSASQKGWLAPPGLAMIAVSAAAMRATAVASCPRWYLDFARQRDSLALGRMRTTPPLSVLYALREGLSMMREEGLERIWRRHERTAHRIRTGLRAIGLEPIARPACASNTVTAVRSPCRSADALLGLLADLRVHHGVVLAEGLGVLEGRSFRIGHLGAITDADALAILTALSDALGVSSLAA